MVRKFLLTIGQTLLAFSSFAALFILGFVYGSDINYSGPTITHLINKGFNFNELVSYFLALLPLGFAAAIGVFRTTKKRMVFLGLILGVSLAALCFFLYLKNQILG